VSWSLQKLAKLRADVSLAARRLSRTSGVPITEEGREAALQQTVALLEVEGALQEQATAPPPASYDFFEAHPACALPARFQGMCGSCVTYAITNSLAHRLCKKGTLKRHLSVPYVLGCGEAAKAAKYEPMAVCSAPTDPFDLLPVLQQVLPSFPLLSRSAALFFDCFFSWFVHERCRACMRTVV
jgi:hypothetical protein